MGNNMQYLHSKKWWKIKPDQSSHGTTRHHEGNLQPSFLSFCKQGPVVWKNTCIVFCANERETVSGSFRWLIVWRTIEWYSVEYWRGCLWEERTNFQMQGEVKRSGTFLARGRSLPSGAWSFFGPLKEDRASGYVCWGRTMTNCPDVQLRADVLFVLKLFSCCPEGL